MWRGEDDEKLNTEKIVFFRYLIFANFFEKINTEKIAFFRYLIFGKNFSKIFQNFFSKN